MFIQALTPGEKLLLDCLDDAADNLRNLWERWENRPTLENVSFVEKYSEGRFSVILHFEFLGTRYQVSARSRSHGKTAIDQTVGSDSSIYMIQSDDRNQRYQQPVLVHNVELIQCDKGIIPSRIRLDGIVDQIKNVFPNKLYFSTLENIFKFVPVFGDGEIKVMRGFLSGHRNNFKCNMVKGGTEIVNGVSDEQRDPARDRNDHLKLEQIISGIQVFLDAKLVKIAMTEFFKKNAQLLDVLIGPFDL